LVFPNTIYFVTQYNIVSSTVTDQDLTDLQKMTKLKITGLYKVWEWIAAKHYDQSKDLKNQCKGRIQLCPCDIAKDWRQVEDTIFVLMKYKVEHT